ncbi:transcriptional repressor [bacterium]|nr:transcriptional repressor [bacterium]
MKKTDPREFFTQYLRRNKYRVTPERFEILDAVLECNGHFDADELFLKMKSLGSKVSRATVYNTLDKLTECGIVSRYRFGERLARYEIMFGNEHHHHVICRSCGTIEEFVDKRVERLARDAARSLNYQFQDAVLHIYGLCEKCRKTKDD